MINLQPEMSVCSYDTNLRIPSDFYIHFQSGGPIHINAFAFLTPPMQTAS